MSPTKKGSAHARRQLDYESRLDNKPAPPSSTTMHKKVKRTEETKSSSSSSAYSDFFTPRSRKMARTTAGPKPGKKLTTVEEKLASDVETLHKNPKLLATPDLISDGSHLGETIKKHQSDDDDDVGDVAVLQEQDIVQTYTLPHLYKNVEYVARKTNGESPLASHNQAHLSKEMKKVYHFVLENFDVPPNFETNRSYGPWSGSSFEERLIGAYSQGKLRPKAQDEHSQKNKRNSDGYPKNVTLSKQEETFFSCGLPVHLQMCTFCAQRGHMREGCSDLL